MKSGNARLRVGIVAVMLSLLWGLGAEALTLQPAGDFEAKGRMLLGTGIVSARCEAVLSGSVTPEGQIRIDSMTFSGANPACKRIYAKALPWLGEPISSDLLQIKGMQVEVKSVLLGTVCGAAHVKGRWLADKSTVQFPLTPLAPNCRFEGDLHITPFIQVQP